MSFNPHDAFKEMAAGNQEAEDLMVSLYAWVQIFDDLIDRDKEWPVEFVVGVQMNLFETLATNSFFQKHRVTILHALQTAAVAYVASEKFAKDERVLERVASQVLKSQYVDVFLHIAALVGGMRHQVAMSNKYRSEIYWDPVPPPNKAV